MPGAFAQQAADVVAPEGASGVAAKAAVHAEKHMVVAANPLAAEAGLDVLRAGGTAADALVAVQTMLGLVEPQSSGLGGGAFLVWFDAATGTLTTFDGRETAPAAASGTLFLDAAGKPLDFFAAVVGGRSVGVPGVPRLLETVHARFGKRPWAGRSSNLRRRWRRQASRCSPRMAAMIADDAGRLDAEPAARAYFFDAAGAPLPPGALLRNPDYAATLRLLAEGGADAFYKGPLAEAIVAAVRGHPTNPGLLSAEDMEAYAVKERAAVCAPYRGFDVCGMGPPSSGAIAIGQILGMVEPFDCSGLGPEDPVAWRVIGDATRLAFADRERYVADADFVRLPARPARPHLPGGARGADPPADRASGGGGNGGRTALGQGGAQDRRRAGGNPLDLARHHRRRSRQRRRHDDLGGKRLRLAADGRRLPAQQPADRLLLRPGRTARRWPTASSRASGRARRCRRRSS